MLDSAGSDARARVGAALRPASAQPLFRNSKFDGTKLPMVVLHLRTAIRSMSSHHGGVFGSARHCRLGRIPLEYPAFGRFASAESAAQQTIPPRKGPPP